MLAGVSFSFGLLWVSIWNTVCCFVIVALSCILKILHSFPNDFFLCLACIIISISECGLESVFRTLLSNLKTLWGEKSYLLWLLLLSAKTDLYQSSSLSFRPILCKKSKFFMLNAIKIIIIPDENVLLQFSLNILKVNLMVSFPLSVSVSCWRAFGMNY